MKLTSYIHDGQMHVGAVVEDDSLISLSASKGGNFVSMKQLIAQWDRLNTRIEEMVANGKATHSMSDVILLAPIVRPGKIFAIGLNYEAHIAEGGREKPENQTWFTKAQTSVNGPYAPIQIARGSSHVDYEVEMVAVIGKRGKHISKETALQHVFGYCVGNDVTERFWQHRSLQWSLGKSFDTHAPMGPWLTTHDEIGDPQNLNISCHVNGEERQSSNTSKMIYSIAEQIEHLSAAMTLEPGDVIFTGTPEGVGAAMDPRQFLQPGDRVRCEVEKLGAIEAVCINEGEKAAS